MLLKLGQWSSEPIPVPFLTILLENANKMVKKGVVNSDKKGSKLGQYITGANSGTPPFFWPFIGEMRIKWPKGVVSGLAPTNIV